MRKIYWLLVILLPFFVFACGGGGGDGGSTSPPPEVTPPSTPSIIYPEQGQLIGGLMTVEVLGSRSAGATLELLIDGTLRELQAQAIHWILM